MRKGYKVIDVNFFEFKMFAQYFDTIKFINGERDVVCAIVKKE